MEELGPKVKTSQARTREPESFEHERLPQTSVRLHDVRQMLSLFLLAPSGLGLGCFLTAAVIQTKARRNDRGRRGLSCMHAAAGINVEQPVHPSPIDREAAGKEKLHHGGGRPGPATPAREAVTPLSVGLGFAAMAVATVEQQNARCSFCKALGWAQLCRATPSVFGRPFGAIPSSLRAHKFVTTTRAQVRAEKAPISKRGKSKKICHTLGRRHLRRVVVNDICLMRILYNPRVHVVVVLCCAMPVVGVGVDPASLNVKRRAEREPDSWDGRRRYDRRYPQRCNPRIGI